MAEVPYVGEPVSVALLGSCEELYSNIMKNITGEAANHVEESQLPAVWR